MPSSTITGLNSGLQWADTVKLLVQLERRPLVLLEERRATHKSQLNNWSGIESKLSALRSAADAIESSNELLTKSISTSDDTILTASGDSEAIPGTHQILINQLASNHILAHTAGWADTETTEVNSSGSNKSFSYSYAGENFTVTVPDGTTLAGLVRLINNDPDNPGVVASILNDGNGGATPYHLILAGKDQGEDNTIAILDTVGNPTNLGDGDDFDAAAWSTTQTAKNSQIRVDGFPDPGWGWPTPWIEADSNEVEDVIPGVKLRLQNVTSGTPIQIEIALNKADVKAKVNSLIKAYNDVVSTVNTLTSYNTETSTSGPLASDTLARSLRSEFTSLVASPIPGADEDDRFTSLGEIGVKLSAGGTLKLDSSKFDEALDIDPQAVARLLVFESAASTGYVSVERHTDATVGGNYAFSIAYDASGNIDPNGTNTIGGEPATIQGDVILSGKSDTDVEGLLLRLTNPGGGPATLNGTLKIYTGLAAMLTSKINQMTDSIDGQLTLNKERIKDQVENLDDRIANWEVRMKKIEENFNKRFQAMETLIGQLRTQSNYLGGLG